LILPDVNVLIYAFHQEGQGHAEHFSWWESVLNGEEFFGISRQVLNSFVRITSQRTVYDPPYRMEDIFAFCDDVLSSPVHRLVEPGRRHWKIFRDLCLTTGVRGNLVQDAWFAALAIEHDCEWITHDTDYRRFPGLRRRPPF
jgi:uncharacterized protein